MNYYNIKDDDVLKKLHTTRDGLTDQEVEKRLKINGQNVLKEDNKELIIVKFLNEFNDIMIIILCIAAIISAIISYINNESYIDSIVIIAIVVLNAILGFIQQIKADKALEALKKMQTTKVKVKRNNSVKVINSEDIVQGDILILEAGDIIPADARIIWQTSLKCDESSLTGESETVSKNTKIIKGNTCLSERSNMIFSGTSVVFGKCEAVVTDTGMNTEFGKIAQSLNESKKDITPLEKKINSISKFLSIIISIIIAVMFVIGLVRGMNIAEVIMLSISLAVAAIPEGLPAVITITLSLGVSSMAKKKAIVRQMASVETLGSTEIICSDKTGTITQNKMTVQEICYDNKIYDTPSDKNHILLNIMALNNDATKNTDEFVGDPTEIALYEYCDKYFDVELLRNQNIRVAEIPFDSDRKMMTTIHANKNDIIMYTKGSFDSLINHCSKVLINNKIVKLDSKLKKELKQIETEESDKAYRVLAYAYKYLNDDYECNINLENDLIFVGMSSMIDPPRKDVKEAIKTCKKANIRPIMITGDSLATAKAIAKDIGILTNDDEAITGIEIDKMSDDELLNNIHKYSVYARVSPTNKLSIVNAWKKSGKVVAMTGDGVNDAPALKTANIGVGMGITGTEVSKSVSDIILVDDSFSTIVSAVKEGRRIFDNIRNVLMYLLTGNIAEIIVIFIAMLFGKELFLPIQLLYINLITDSIPAIALSFEKEANDVMERKVRKKNSSIFTPYLVAKIMSSAVIKTCVMLGVFMLSNTLYGQDIATTMTFLTLILSEMIFAYSCRNITKSVLNKNIFDNKYLNISFILLIIIQIILFVSPLKIVFGINDLNIMQVTICIVIVLLMFIIDEISKKYIIKKFRD